MKHKVLGIRLGRGRVAHVDMSMRSILKPYKWYARKSSGTSYAFGYLATGDSIKITYLHHVIVGYPLNGLVVDHIDGNGLNNVRANLRIVTKAINSTNTHKKRNGSLRNKHVDWSKPRTWKRLGNNSCSRKSVTLVA